MAFKDTERSGERQKMFQNLIAGRNAAAQKKTNAHPRAIERQRKALALRRSRKIHA